MNRYFLIIILLFTVGCMAKNKNKEKVKYVIEKVIECGGINYATKKMNEFKERSLDVLHQFPDNPYRKGLEDLLNFVTERKY